MKSRTKLGVSIAAIALLAAVIVWQVQRVSIFKSSAMRFVAAEAIGFVAIPNLERFFDNGVPPVNETLTAVINQPNVDFVKGIIPQPHGLPAPCIELGKSSDLAKNGLVPQGSLSVAVLDSGVRAAVKLNSDGSGLLFLADLLFPAYAQLSYQSDQSEETSKGAKYRFTLTAQSKDVDFCPQPDWRPKDAPGSELVIEGPADTISLPMRFHRSVLGMTVPPTVEISCMVAKNSEPAKPCGCGIVEQGVGGNENPRTRRTSCGQGALADRAKDLATWSTELQKGRTVMIGDQYVVVIDGFHVIESLLPGVRKPAKYQISPPTVSIVNDDTLLSQFASVAAPDKQNTATILAGVRPDAIVSATEMRNLPMYLVIPVGIHFEGNKIGIDILSNLEPQDSAIVQTIAAASKSEASQRGWSNWRKALGGKLSDSSLKLYARFLRSYFPDVDEVIATYSPLAQVAIDIMEQGAGSIVVSVNEFQSNPNVARLAIAVPDIDSEIAGSVVTRSRRLSIVRQANYVTDKAAALAQRRGAGKDDLESAVKGLYCAASLWRLDSIALKRAATAGDAGVRPAADDESEAEGSGDASTAKAPTVAKSKPVVAINEEAFASDSVNWSVTVPDLVRFQRILPPDDPNVGVWGNAYINGTGAEQKDEAEVKPQADDFVQYLREFKSNLNDKGNDLQTVLDVMAPKLMNYATFLENKRSFARKLDLVSLMRQTISATSVDATLVKVDDLLGKLKNLPELEYPGPDEIESFCKTVQTDALPQYPLAFYDRHANVLFVVEDTKIITSLTASSPDRDPDGKLLIGLEAPQLAKLLKLKDDDAKPLIGFPFGRFELTLNGREAGTGIAAQLSLSRIDKK